MYPYSRLAGKALKTALSLAGMDMVAADLEVDDFFRFMSMYGETILYDESRKIVGRIWLLSPDMKLSIDDDETLVVAIDGTDPTGEIDFRYEIVINDLDAFVRPERRKDFYPEDLELPPGIEIKGDRFFAKVGFSISEEDFIKLLTLPPARKKPRAGAFSGKVIKAHGPPNIKGV